MNIVGVIPARYASTRLPAKPLVDLCGKPMVQRVVDQARQATLLLRVVVATDDKRIADVLSANGSEPSCVTCSATFWDLRPYCATGFFDRNTFSVS